MATFRRKIRKNNKSRKQKREKRGGATRHWEDDDLRMADNYANDNNGDTVSFRLNEYLKKHPNAVDFEEIKNIHDTILKGHQIITEGYKRLSKLMNAD